ncbi:MAG: hypothetical protein M3290_12610, partial [Actinomycetota bacterium]|nr:hypothetical protein [Actinomycetota bacterium]
MGAIKTSRPRDNISKHPKLPVSTRNRIGTVIALSALATSIVTTTPSLAATTGTPPGPLSSPPPITVVARSPKDSPGYVF